ncbi:polyprenol reductase [Condylostylus longicornis]|uniref:polyprenol reductase n=1 Tax=Condylostylus longicornis TaxID=2530218 RepID=UPI00244E2D8C|nr:polyprenol reductase [Condylostylus longicornis]
MEIHLVNFIFLNFTVVVLLVGVIVNLKESYLPQFVSQAFRYGKHKHKGKTNTIINLMEIPKSCFKHFYAFALFWSLWGLYLVLKTIILSTPVPDGIVQFLDLVAGGSYRPILVKSSSALIAIVLLSIQCVRRFYETWMMQIFSSNGKINISHYFVGYLHYFGAVIAILANTEGFVKGSKPSPFSLNKVEIYKFIFIIIFHIAWKQQFNSNKILVEGRMDQNGKISQDHILPRGGFFDLISSPHMFFEIVIYLSIFGIIPESQTWLYCTIWVTVNQIQNALLTHKWYLTTFKDYPKQRKAIIPFIL